MRDERPLARWRLVTTRVNDADVRAKVKQVLQQAQAEEVQSRYELLTGHLLDAVDLDRLPVPKPLIDGVLNLRSEPPR